VIPCSHIDPHKEDCPMAETPAVAPPYEPPRIEQILTPEDLEREVQYAGVPSVIT
jgi:hypothetical protein